MKVTEHLKTLDPQARKRAFLRIINHTLKVKPPKRKDLSLTILQHKSFHTKYTRAQKAILDQLYYSNNDLRYINLEYLDQLGYYNNLGKLIYYKPNYHILLNILRRLLNKDIRLVNNTQIY